MTINENVKTKKAIMKMFPLIETHTNKATGALLKMAQTNQLPVIPRPRSEEMKNKRSETQPGRREKQEGRRTTQVQPAWHVTPRKCQCRVLSY